MIKNVCILNYGLGNILSLKNAITHLGFKNNFYSDMVEKNYDCLILPGVGSFAKAMSLLKRNKLEKIIQDAHKKKILIIGICLGMQLLFDRGYEEKLTNGLSLIEGEIKMIDKLNLKLPHVGWKKTQFLNIEKNSFFSKFENQKFYYVHSYVAKLNNNKNILATAYYHNYKFIAGVKKENLIGFQFHPEKSGEVGLELINDLFRNY